MIFFSYEGCLEHSNRVVGFLWNAREGTGVAAIEEPWRATTAEEASVVTWIRG